MVVLFCTDCGCDRDPVIHPYNNHDDELPNPNDLDVNLSHHIAYNNSVHGLRIGYSTLNLKKRKKPGFVS